MGGGRGFEVAARSGHESLTVSYSYRPRRRALTMPGTDTVQLARTEGLAVTVVWPQGAGRKG
ncbi:hypothetical protein [Streptomyces albus]|uniref:hypothetical protein n=1 Tax=Streptomyces albus TaxID=1888 RepID=UPI0033D7AC22